MHQGGPSACREAAHNCWRSSSTVELIGRPPGSWLSQHPSHDRTRCLHYDVSPDNLLIKNGQIRALIDWEKAISGPPEWDLANTREAMIYRWFESDSIPSNLERKFFNSYRACRKLSCEWKKKVLYYETLQRFRYMADFEKIAAVGDWTEDERENREAMYRNIFRQRLDLTSKE